MSTEIIKEDIDELSEEFRQNFFKKRILVTGGAGFLGSWLCDVFVESGAFVDCLDNLSTGKSENIHQLKDKMKVIVSEVEEANLVEKYDYIFHFSSRASPEEYMQHQVETLRSNSLGTMKMLELARRCGSVFVHASTSEIYGDAQIIPTPETYFGNVNPIGMRACYDESKRFGEALCMAYSRQRDVDVKIARIFNSYGPRIREDGLYARALPRFISQALKGVPITIYGDGKQTRSFCYVSDTIRGILRLACLPKGNDIVFNIGNPNEITILQLANAIIKETNSSSSIDFFPALPDDPKRRCPDIARGEKILGWKPQILFQQGLLKTITWFKFRL